MIKHCICLIILCSSLPFSLVHSQDRSAARRSELVHAGVVVEEVDRASALERAGLEPGDHVLTWQRMTANGPDSREAARGTVQSVFDWMWLECEQAPRGTIRLLGERRGEALLLEVAVGPWGGRVRPWMPRPWVDQHLKGRALVDAKQFGDAVASWEQVAALARDDRDPALLIWLKLQIAHAWDKGRQWEKAQGAYRGALDQAQDTNRGPLEGPMARAAVWNATASSHVAQDDFAAAESSLQAALEVWQEGEEESLCLARNLVRLGSTSVRLGKAPDAESRYQQALEIQQRLAPGSHLVADTLNGLGTVAYYYGNDLALAGEMYEQAIEIYQTVAPGSLVFASLLSNQASVVKFQGDLDLASEYLQRSAKIKGELAPGSQTLATTFNKMGLLALDRGTLEKAHEHFSRALEIFEELAPGGLQVALVWRNLGVVALHRGDLQVAEKYDRSALEIQQRVSPQSLQVAETLVHLGNVAWFRGDLDRARELYQESLDIRRERLPGGIDLAISLDSLGNVALAQGELDRATEYFGEAHDIWRQQAPGGLNLAVNLNSLGEVALARGEADRARSYHQQALDINRKLAPQSVAAAATFNFLGTAAMAQGELLEAQSYHQQALHIREQLAPGSRDLAETLNQLGILAHKQRQLDVAAGYFDRSLDVLEAQIGRVGSSEVTRGGFRAQYAHLYQAAIALSVERQRPEEAFATLERFRARSFLALLVERDLLFAADISAQLREAREGNAASYDRAQQRLASLNPEQDQAQIQALLAELRTLRRERDEIANQVLEASPRLGALQYPQPQSVAGAREALDPGTLMLAYSVGRDQTHLFALSRETGLEVHSLALEQEELGRQVDLFRQLIRQAGPSQGGAASRLESEVPASIKALGRHLYDALLAPVTPRIETSQRLLIVADGALHLLPFGALNRELPGVPDGRYLAEWKPLHSVLSATVYAELKKSRSQPGSPGAPEMPVQLAAFGDPRYGDELVGGTEVGDVELRSVASRGFAFSPLPQSRREVEEIARLYPRQATHLYLGEEATEERAKSMGAGVRYLHFATHSVVDPRVPLNSGLVLTTPKEFGTGRENGFLQAWEILEELRLDAELVVLSSCDSGLGGVQAGEGLVGLTRAFHFAGARSVASTLWEVEDTITAELMVRFYRYLKAGQPKDEALRSAQLELLTQPIRVPDGQGKGQERDVSAPYYWAAFQIFGDWQ